MFNLLHQETVVKIGCVVRKETEFQKAAVKNRKKIEFGDFEVWTISKEDLILSKLHWAKDTKSEMQMGDVINMLRTEYDENYVKTRAEKLGVEDLLDKCLKMLKQTMLKDTTKEIAEMQNALWLQKNRKNVPKPCSEWLQPSAKL